MKNRDRTEYVNMLRGEIERADAIGKWKILRRVLRRHPEWVDEFVFCPRWGGYRLRRPSGIGDPVAADQGPKSPDPVTGQAAPVTPYSSGRIGATPEQLAELAAVQRSGAKIAGDPK